MSLKTSSLPLSSSFANIVWSFLWNNFVTFLLTQQKFQFYSFGKNLTSFKKRLLQKSKSYFILSLLIKSFKRHSIFLLKFLSARWASFHKIAFPRAWCHSPIISAITNFINSANCMFLLKTLMYFYVVSKSLDEISASYSHKPVLAFEGYWNLNELFYIWLA